MSEEEKEINKKIEELKQQKEQLWFEEEKAYRCKQCGNIVMKINSLNKEEEKGLCYNCWAKEVKEDKRKELMQKFKDAKIVHIEPEDSPYNSINDIEIITLEVVGERYEVKVAGYGECYIKIEKV